MSGSDPSAGHAGRKASAAGPEDDGPGILGSLPRNRPAVRSPRRVEAAEPDSARDDRAATDADQTDETAPRDPRPERGREAEVEALARAGISLAGEAATLGLRLAGRAAAALRDAAERR